MDGDWNRLVKTVDNLAHFESSAILKDIGDELVSNIQERFEREVAPDGTAWEKSIRARIQGGQTLNKDGHLKSSFDYHLSADKVEAGTNMIYATAHQEGMEIKYKKSKRVLKLPKREMVGFSKKDIDYIDQAVSNAVEENLK